MSDFADTAALIANLDLVITVDTSTAHLAGALGKAVWLLDRLDGCWRWSTSRDDTPWYPTMRIFTQRSRGDWSSVVESVGVALQSFAEAPHGTRGVAATIRAFESFSQSGAGQLGFVCEVADTEPSSGAELFRQTALHKGGQAERAAYFDNRLPALRRHRDWSAMSAGVSDDGTVLYHKEGQIRVLVIKTDGGVYTGSWNEEVISEIQCGEVTLTCDWSSPGWKRW